MKTTIPYKDIISKKNNCSYINRSVLVVRNVPVEPIMSDYMQYFEVSSCVDYYNEKEVLFIDNKYDVAVIFIDLPTLLPDFYATFFTQSKDSIEKEKDFLKVYLTRLLKHIHSISERTLFYSFLPDPTFNNSQWNSFVFSVNQLVRGNIVSTNEYVELWEFVIREGWNQISYSTYEFSLKSKFRPSFFHYIVETIKKALIPPEKIIKWLAIDCDEVLWGGIVSEDGVGGISLSDDGVGRHYRLFQRELSRLFQQGIIGTICSKNNLQIVKRVFQQHPDMLLKWDDFAAFCVNWKDKASNIKALSEKLNLQLEHLLFIDDDPHEIAVIKKVLPEVQTLFLNSNYPERYIDELNNFSFSLEEKNFNRNLLYRQNNKRQSVKKDFVSVEEFNTRYHTVCDVHPIRQDEINRVIQLSLRSNQFNLSLKRFSQSELETIMNNINNDVLCLNVVDDFGDLGLVGVATIFYCQQTACIDSFIFSCRAMGRDLEKTFMNEILKYIQKRGIGKIIGKYYVTEKNRHNTSFFSEYPIIPMEINK